eukprot:CAMPEP_0113687840 /NCGR_PEP_ID=MMETSP0038_2-20120614/16176_1 /TAXON_ID=2898 /ORGANISM="Cryptomonas paramecium" /LENGTH=71 /DNA_ID=CAMNT_0000608533 /DNA_START=41 /DNA_END=256 /DNA_ORIENTATION=+ /assembly_acc=CAM_ASM_000170
MNARAIVKALIPATRRAASGTATKAAEGSGVLNILYPLPMFVAFFGYGGIVCFHETGALRRIRRSFAEIPH